MSTIESTEQATDVAVAFLNKHNPVIQRPLRARFEDGTWLVEIDVGAFYTRVAKVTIDAESGRILEYNVPPSPFPPPPPGLRQL